MDIGQDKNERIERIFRKKPDRTDEKMRRTKHVDAIGRRQAEVRPKCFVSPAVQELVMLIRGWKRDGEVVTEKRR